MLGLEGKNKEKGDAIDMLHKKKTPLALAGGGAWHLPRMGPGKTSELLPGRSPLREREAHTVDVDEGESGGEKEPSAGLIQKGKGLP